MEQGTAAEAAGLKTDDVLLTVGDNTALATQQTISSIRVFKPGSTVQLSLWREGQKRDLTVVLGTRTIREWRPLYWDTSNARDIHWLIRDHTLTVLPAVSSLKALRRVARPGGASKPMIGFGNPLLDGRQNDPEFGAYYKKLAQRAREKQRCPETAWQRVAALVGLRRGLTPVQTRGGLADVDFLRMQAPLPETADELCAVARDVHADPAEIRLGARATEREVKRLSASGQLAQYRIVHFATHGALAGQIRAIASPAFC